MPMTMDHRLTQVRSSIPEGGRVDSDVADAA